MTKLPDGNDPVTHDKARWPSAVARAAFESGAPFAPTPPREPQESPPGNGAPKATESTNDVLDAPGDDDEVQPVPAVLVPWPPASSSSAEVPSNGTTNGAEQGPSRPSQPTRKGKKGKGRKKPAKTGAKHTVIRSRLDLDAILAKEYPHPETGKMLRAPGHAKVAYEYLLFHAARNLADGGEPGQIACTNAIIRKGVKSITGEECSNSTAKRLRTFLWAAGLMDLEKGERRQERGRKKGKELLDTPARVNEVRENPAWFRRAFANQSLLDVMAALRAAMECHKETPEWKTYLEGIHESISAAIGTPNDRRQSDSVTQD